MEEDEAIRPAYKLNGFRQETKAEPLSRRLKSPVLLEQTSQTATSIFPDKNLQCATMRRVMWFCTSWLWSCHLFQAEKGGRTLLKVLS